MPACTPGAGDRFHLRRAAHRDGAGSGARCAPPAGPLGAATCDGRRPGSIHAMRRGTGNTATPSGTGRAARFASASRSGCGPRSTPPRWRGPGRPSSAGTTSAPSGRRTDRRSGPSAWSGSRREGRLVTIDVRADSFLRGMVRRMVAVLLEVGLGKMDETGGPGGTRRLGTGPRRGSGSGQGALPQARRPRAAAGRTERRTRGTMNAKTYSVRESEIERRWYVVDATDETLGRLASRIAARPRGQAQAHLSAEPGLRRPRDRAQRRARSASPATSSRASSTAATAAIPRASSRRRSATCSRGGPKRSSGAP